MPLPFGLPQFDYPGAPVATSALGHRGVGWDATDTGRVETDRLKWMIQRANDPRLLTAQEMANHGLSDPSEILAVIGSQAYNDPTAPIPGEPPAVPLQYRGHPERVRLSQRDLHSGLREQDPVVADTVPQVAAPRNWDRIEQERRNNIYGNERPDQVALAQRQLPLIDKAGLTVLVPDDATTHVAAVQAIAAQLEARRRAMGGQVDIASPWNANSITY